MKPTKEQLEEILDHDTSDILYARKHGCLPSDTAYQAAQWLLDNYDDIQAILDARKCAGEGEWFVWSELNVNYPPTVHAMSPEDNFHQPIDAQQKQQDFAVTAANAAQAIIDRSEG